MRSTAIRYALAASVLAFLPTSARAQGAARAPAMQEDVLVTLKKLLDASSPAGMNDRERAEYAAQTEWLQSAYERVLTAREAGSGMATGRSAPPAATATGDVKTPRDAASGLPTGKRQHGVPARDIVRLVETLEQEGSRFNTLSNASKARHDVAMNAIRNMK